jgi:hypothetical protein
LSLRILVIQDCANILREKSQRTFQTVRARLASRVERQFAPAITRDRRSLQL